MRNTIAGYICHLAYIVSDGWSDSLRFRIAEKIHILDDIVRGTYWGYEDGKRINREGE